MHRTLFSWLPSISSAILRMRANHTDLFFFSFWKTGPMGLKEASRKKAKYLWNEIFEMVLSASANDKHLSWPTSSCYFLLRPSTLSDEMLFLNCYIPKVFYQKNRRLLLFSEVPHHHILISSYSICLAHSAPSPHQTFPPIFTNPLSSFSPRELLHLLSYVCAKQLWHTHALVLSRPVVVCSAAVTFYYLVAVTVVLDK